MKKHHNPSHELATPIIPLRKKCTVKFGNVEYQRTNFPLTLAYAITAHKSQGETLEEVIIDFGPDIMKNIKNFNCPGSFYVVLTRVRMSCKVFLRSIDFKKVYLDAKIF